MITNIYEYKQTLINVKEFDFAELKNKVVLIVNTASKCGFTPQYEQLEQIYQKYKSRDFIVLGFPANDFLFQEPGKDEEIAEFCKINYGVTFPIFSKSHVRGFYINDLFKYLTTKTKFKGSVKWNFEKFLLDKDGLLKERFGSTEKPDSEKVITAIESLL